MFSLSPSIYSADFMCLKDVLEQCKDFEHLHLDIDDGNFVKGISFGTAVVRAIAANTAVPLDAHLEVLNPLDYVDELCKSGVGLITAHVEVLPYPLQFISKVHQYGKKAGLALNLKTPVSYIEAYKDDLDQILLLSVESDYEGLPFRRAVLKKISDLRKIVGKDVEVWVDGGINENNLADVVKAGADVAVVGRAVFGQTDYKAAYEKLLQIGRSKGE